MLSISKGIRIEHVEYVKVAIPRDWQPAEGESADEADERMSALTGYLDELEAFSGLDLEIPDDPTGWLIEEVPVDSAVVIRSVATGHLTSVVHEHDLRAFLSGDLDAA